MDSSVLIILLDRISFYVGAQPPSGSAAQNSLIKLLFLLPSTIFLVITSGCSAAQIQAYNEGHENLERALNNPSDSKEFKSWYFSIMPNPYEQIYPINALGAWVLDGMRCQVDQINENYYVAHPGVKRLPASGPREAVCTQGNQKNSGAGN